MPEALLQLRDLVDALAAEGRLRDVDKEVELSGELAAVARWAIASMTEGDAYAIRFPRIAGHTMPLVLNLFGSWDFVARSLGVTRSEVWSRWADALQSPIEPELVQDGPAQEVVLRDAEADLGRIPHPVWTPGRDRAPYLVTAGVITEPRDGGAPNLGTYRVEIQGQRQLGLSFGSERQHGAMHLASWDEHDEPMPVAIVLGAAPAVSYAAGAKTRYGVDELTIAGGLLGRPVPVVEAITNRLRVPAHAEIIIEGRVRPRHRGPEGPFGEALGYMEAPSTAAVIDVECITHRRDPIVHGLVQQVPTTEGHRLQEVGLLGSVWHYLRDRARVEGLVDMGIVPGSAGVAMIAIAVRQGDRKSGDAVLRAMKMMSWGQKIVVVVDDDIDPHDPIAVNWALSSRVDFAEDVDVQQDAPMFQRDPATFARAEGPKAADGFRAAKLLVNATIRKSCMAVALPSTTLMARVREQWEKTGLPPLSRASGLQRMLDAHPADGIEYRLPDEEE